VSKNVAERQFSKFLGTKRSGTYIMPDQLTDDSKKVEMLTNKNLYQQENIF
jgi:hypothetical protein